MDDEIKSCIESAESIIHKRSLQLRELLFTNDEYSFDDVLQLAEDIKAMSEIIILQCKRQRISI